MKHLLFTILIGLAASPVGSAQTPSSADNKTAEQEIRTAIEQYRTALLKKDTAALERIWTDDYTFINGSGAVLTKAERLANAKSGATNLGTIESDPNMQIRFYAGDVAVVISHVTIKGQYSGKATSGDFRSSLVWVKGSSGWRLACNQITPVASH